MNFKPNGISQYDAVYKACDEIGGKTSLKDLQKLAEKNYGAPIRNNAIIGVARKQWQKKNNKEADCRTYKVQPRRNMLNDNKVSKKQKERLGTLSPQELAKLLKLIGTSRDKFHSIPQLTNAIRKEIVNHSLAMV